MKFYRLILAILRGVRKSYTLWQVREIERTGTNYPCATCGMAQPLPCEHWRNMLKITAPGDRP